MCLYYQQLQFLVDIVLYMPSVSRVLSSEYFAHTHSHGEVCTYESMGKFDHASGFLLQRILDKDGQLWTRILLPAECS